MSLMQFDDTANTADARHRSARCLVASVALFLAAAVLSAQTPPPQIKQIKEDTKGAEQAADRGDKAAATGKTTEALDDYAQAVRLAPGNVSIRRRAAGVRAQAIQNIVDRAEATALQGDMEGATELMYQALQIDPDNTIVAERLAQMKQMAPAFLRQGDHDQNALIGPATLTPQPGKKSVNVRGDARSAYEQVAGMFGIRVAFDPDLAQRNVKLRVDDLDFYSAMELLGIEAKTFYRVVNPTLIFVAEDTLDKRKAYAEEVEQTFSVDSAVAQEDLTEMMRVVREISSVTRINMDTKTHSLTVRDTADKVALAGQLIKEFDQGRRDLMLEVEVLEVDRTKARDLGVTPPSSIQAIPLNSQQLAQLASATDFSNLLTLLGQVFTAAGSSASPTDIFPVGGGKSTFLLTMPNAAATFSDALSLVKSGREILMRAQEGKPATFFVGERFPVTLSLLSTSLGSTVVGSAVSSITFPRTDFAVGTNPVALAAQDFNNDSLKDLAVVNQGDNSISILLNQNNGNFSAAPGSPFKLGTNEQAPSAIAAAIFRITNTTQLVQPGDLVIANSASNTVSVLLGSENFDGTFAEATGSPFNVGAHPSAVVVADFNGDGFLDFAVANENDNTISVFQGDGQGGFTPFPKSPFALPTAEKGPIAMATGVFDNSGKPEIAVLNAATQNVGIFQASFDSTFDGTFAELKGSPVGTGIDPVAFAAGDLNGDGFADLAIVNQSANAVTVLLNDGTGFFTQAQGSPLATASTPAGIVIAPVGGTSAIAVTNNGSSTLSVYLNQGSGTFQAPFELSVPAGPGAVISADFNNDGLPDVALTAHSGTNNFVSVLLTPSSLGGGGTIPGNAAQTPYPGSEYVDLGVKVKATPALHDDNEVTLQLEFEIRALAGSAVNGIPVVTNRTINQTVRLRENETSLITGLLDQEETNSLSGIPGLATLPGFGYTFSNKTKNVTDNELVILVTPRRMTEQIRTARAKYLGRGTAPSSGGAVQQPSPTEP